MVEFHDAGLRAGDGKQILEGLNFSVERGETLVLIGRSGSGKTSTLKLVNRLLEPDSGRVEVDGLDVREWDLITLRRRTGYVIQEGGLFPHFTVGRNVALVPELEGWSPDRRISRARELLEMVGLDPSHFFERYPGELSGGQRQRVCVARALAAEPPLVLMDEPFGALDPISRLDLQRQLVELKRRMDKTILFVTHDMREALMLGTRIGLFRQGRLVGIFTPDEFLASQDPDARAFIESIETDLDPGRGEIG